MYETRNDLQESVRKGIVQLLNDRLAEAIDLQLQAKHAHWNVKGPNFVGLHDLFDRVADAASEYVDLIAERGAHWAEWPKARYRRCRIVRSCRNTLPVPETGQLMSRPCVRRWQRLAEVLGARSMRRPI